jgi:hypothetical protein
MNFILFQEALLHVLQLVLEPPPPAVNAMSDNAKAEYEGLQYGKFMLHHMDRSPYAAIAPVTLLWRPVPKELQSEQSVGLIPAEKRQVWVWVHAAPFDEALMCLQTACQRQASIESIVAVQVKERRVWAFGSARPWCSSCLEEGAAPYVQHKKILLKTPVLSIPQVLHLLLGFTQSC